jgi:hypothetical protein
MIFDRNMFKFMLNQVDPLEMQEFSSLNHHVEGMDYLCLHRSKKLTVKLYLIEDPQNPNSGFLVNPHSHRYAFGSRVLHGKLDHLRFHPYTGQDWIEHSYDPENKTMSANGETRLLIERETHRRDSSYFVNENEIHTLQMYPGKGPVLLGLVQLQDTREKSELYIPAVNNYKLNTVKPETPSIAQIQNLIDRSLELIK